MDTTDYVATLRRRLAASSLPIRSKRLDELFGALLTCPPAEVQQVAALVASVVETLVDPRRRMAMWKKMETLSGQDWRELATKRVVRSATRQRPRRLAPPKPVREPTTQQIEQTAMALLGVVSHAVQGAGHYQLELERLVLAGRCAESSAAWDLLRRLESALRAAERERHVALIPLARLAGKVLAVVEEHQERVAEVAPAFEGLSSEQLPLLAQRHQDARELEQKQLEACIVDLGLGVSSSEEVAEIAARLHRRRDLAACWGKPERKVIRSLEMHLRQGEELRAKKAMSESSSADSGRCLPGKTASMSRFHLAYRRSAELIARLVTTDSALKTPIWWERVVRAGLREIEIDSLGAKRLKASRQSELAAEALSSVEQRAPSERCMEEEIAAELGRSLGQLEFELKQRPGDPALQTRIAQTRQLRAHFLSKQKEKARARLQDLAEGARQRASAGESLADSDWLFEME